MVGREEGKGWGCRLPYWRESVPMRIVLVRDFPAFKLTKTQGQVWEPDLGFGVGLVNFGFSKDGRC